MIKKNMSVKLTGSLLLMLLVCVSVALPVHAKQESETAGSSMGKETGGSIGTAVSPAQLRMTTGWIYDDASGRWWYRDSDGSYPALSWRKIDGVWYYFDKDGWWVDNNKHEAGSIKGIDVSEWQENIDWQAVKNDGIEFAFVRVGYGTTRQIDKYYARNMREANAAGVPVGVYFYSKAQNEAQAILDAQFVIEQMRGYLVSYPVVIDLEDASQAHLSKQELGRIAKAYCDEIRAAGYTPMLYCNENWYNNRIDVSMLQDVEKWVARYHVTYSESIPRGIWQCCSTGRIAGISGNTDIDFGYKDYTQIVTPRTEPQAGYSKTTGSWVKNDSGWWYNYLEGGYPANQWEYIGGSWYWFDGAGYMATGWQYIGNTWYYLHESGAMATGWLLLGDTWYYLHESGAMATGWLLLGDTWYYLHGSGAMATGWLLLGDTWYYLHGSGAMATGWLLLGDTWYYLHGSGAMATGWLLLGDTWYYLYGSGAMATGWLLLGDTWYYLHGSGAMATGWQYIGNAWYYLDGSGAMWENCWLGDYWLGSGGAMAVSSWVDGGRYYVDENGCWVSGI